MLKDFFFKIDESEALSAFKQRLFSAFILRVLLEERADGDPPKGDGTLLLPYFRAERILFAKAVNELLLLLLLSSSSKEFGCK